MSAEAITPRRRRSRAPLLILLAIIAHIMLWVAWLTLAGMHPVATVPLAR